MTTGAQLINTPINAHSSDSSRMLTQPFDPGGSQLTDELTDVRAIIRAAAEAAVEKDRLFRQSNWKETHERLDKLSFVYAEYSLVDAGKGKVDLPSFLRVRR